jgi:hypothetical protein
MEILLKTLALFKTLAPTYARIEKFLRRYPAQANQHHCCQGLGFKVFGA